MTSITAYHYIKIVEVLVGFCDAHRSLPLHQALQLLGVLATRTATYQYIRISTLGRPRDALRSLPLHKDLQLLGGLVTPTAIYHYIKILNSLEIS